MKTLGSIAFFVFALSATVVAQQPVTTLTENDIRTCPEYEVYIQGPKAGKINTEQTYTLKSTIPGAEIGSISHELWSGEEFLQGFEQGTLQYTFSEQGEYLIKSLVTTTSGCTYVSQEIVSAYEHIFVYIGSGSEEFTLIKESLQRPETLLYAIEINADTLQNTNAVVNTLVENKLLIENADTIILDSQSLGTVLGALPDVERVSPINMENASMYVLSTINNSAFRRLMGTYRSLSGIKEINVIPQNTLGSLVNGLLLGKNIEELGFVKQYTIEQPGKSRWFVMSYFIDSLLIDGVPLQTVLLLLLLPVLGLVVTFYRHVVGFSTYGVYASVLLGLAFYTVGLIPVALFLFTGLLAVVFTNLLVKRVYVLSAAKQALVVSFYALFLIIVFVAQNNWGMEWIAVEQFNNTFMIFIILYILIISNSLFKETGQLFKKKWITKMIQFTLVIVTVLAVLRWNWLHNLLLGYPEVVIAVLLGIFTVGRYTGLQATEYLRFRPLIARTMTDHEEEE